MQIAALPGARGQPRASQLFRGFTLTISTTVPSGYLACAAARRAVLPSRCLLMNRCSFSIRVVLQVFSLACLLLAASAAVAAPAPLGSKAVPASPAPNCELAGTWIMQWQNGTGTATFFREGGYLCDWCGQRWIGSWRIEQ